MMRPNVTHQRSVSDLAASMAAADRAASTELSSSGDEQVCRECNAQGNCDELRTQLAQNTHEQEQAMLASATYDPDAPLPEGYRRATDEDLQRLGLSDGETSLLSIDGEPDFHAEAFIKDDGSAAIGFKGTNFSSLSDWGNNFGQGLGNDTPYYSRARTIGLIAGSSGQDVSFVGHSLGGGLAATASGARGLPAQTFNSAGLSQSTLDRLGFENPTLVNATHVQGDILNGLQDNTPIPDAFGVRRGIPAASGDDWRWGDSLSAAVGSVLGSILGGGAIGSATLGTAAAYGTRGVRLHGMESVENALDQERDMILRDMETNGC